MHPSEIRAGAVYRGKSGPERRAMILTSTLRYADGTEVLWDTVGKPERWGCCSLTAFARWAALEVRQ